MDANPYRSPEIPPSALPSPAGVRPASLIVFGVLNLVFGVLGVCGTAASSAMFFVDLPRDPAVPNPALDLIQSDAGYRLFMQVMIAIGILFAIVLIVAGIGLLLSRAWGRTLSIIYGWYAIIGAVVGMIANWIYLIQPLLAKLNEAGGAGGPAVTMAIGGAVGSLAGGCFGLIYPIILLVFMNRPALRDWLTGRAAAGPDGR